MKSTEPSVVSSAEMAEYERGTLENPIKEVISIEVHDIDELTSLAVYLNEAIWRTNREFVMFEEGHQSSSALTAAAANRLLNKLMEELKRAYEKTSPYDLPQCFKTNDEMLQELRNRSSGGPGP